MCNLCVQEKRRTGLTASKRGINSFYQRLTTITHQPFHLANNRAAPPAIIIWACERECVYTLYNCRVTGICLYSFCSLYKVVRCWFTFQRVIEKENHYKSLTLAVSKKKSAFGEWNETTHIRARLSFRRCFCAHSRLNVRYTTQRLKPF